MSNLLTDVPHPVPSCLDLERSVESMQALESQLLLVTVVTSMIADSCINIKPGGPIRSGSDTRYDCYKYGDIAKLEYRSLLVSIAWLGKEFEVSRVTI